VTDIDFSRWCFDIIDYGSEDMKEVGDLRGDLAGAKQTV
jgi:hypothetical protein